jgi:hypothetical protein
MIGIITFILAVLVLGTSFGLFNFSNYFDVEKKSYGSEKTVRGSTILKLVLVLIVPIVI